ncbi:Chromosome partition protein Smc [Hyella patelloides LEGE 07179]|uniref:Chromosome partition protein Smc n=1 Tax=Hyella patelloides LEGE 07179 TaxID=945734 RepID=A0A563W081_9CYAN|nr:AAA family ATPase [Hyella patelloides]VEP17070.1 Chromosome partition protein Smc [Hyella patelloides LEGE 07179]
MVHIKRVELTHFKSFGGSTKIPILPGFTVVSGPNGSGKSNILDALLFCLGLASSKGMRAERLPDLVNHKQNTNGKAAETIVSVTFDLDGWDGFSDVERVENLERAVLKDTASLKDSLRIVRHEVSPLGHKGAEEAEKDREDNEDNEEEQQPTTNHPQLTKLKEWTVTRRLRVSKKGSYSSTFYLNGEVCSATEIHEQLEQLRIYPEGYNVVLQGDVTRIINMNSRERREIIDELAGVAAFDRKIEQTRKTLEKVKEREEHCHIIEQELIGTRDRLAADRVKAEKYRKLKQQVQEKKQQEIVLFWRSLVQQKEELHAAITKDNEEIASLTKELANLSQEIESHSNQLAELNSRVRALGEDEQLSVASELATQKAKRNQLQQRQTELQSTVKQKELLFAKTQENLQQYQRELEDLTDVKNKLDRETIPQSSQQYNQAKNLLKERREIADTIAAASEAWVQEQANLTREISTLQNKLNPQRTEQATITERLAQTESKITEETTTLEAVGNLLQEKNHKLQSLTNEVTVAQDNIQSLAEQFSNTESDRDLQRETQQRLLLEQRSKQRELDKLEATKQAQQEAQGTYASKVILNANLAGVHGLVVQLGKVEPQYHLALETAAGGRLGYIVVENDGVGAQGIELLKQQRAGRATFLPLNKIKAPRKDNLATMRFGRGYIDFAVNLVTCEARYRDIFGYVFGNTIVFDTIDNARSLLGKQRIVTLEGDILEISGAMSGGSKSSRSSLRFGKVTTNESREVAILKERLAEITSILTNNDQRIAQLSNQVKKLGESLTEAKQFHREKQLRLEQLQTEIKQLTAQQEQLTKQLATHQQEKENIKKRSQFLNANLPEQETKLQQLQQKLNELESSHDQSEWQQIQTAIKAQEKDVQEKETIFRQAENRLKDTNNQIQRLTEKASEAEQQINDLGAEQATITNQQSAISKELQELAHKITTAETKLQQLNQQLGETKENRDRTELQLKKLQNKQQQKSWQKEKLEATQKEKNANLVSLESQIKERELELSGKDDNLENKINQENNQETVVQDNIEEEQNKESLWNELYQKLFDVQRGEKLPTITHAILQEKLEQLQKQIRNGEKRLEAMEPVNMLALEEYEKTEARLQELSEKLSTIAAERTELLLRVEKFTTLRLRAFKEAYDAVDINFQKIFAELSEGDGHLQLEDAEDPFNGGLMLVAHPKGKPVQRLSSMSGGEKSLTALSFIFSLQKYRPSPFYAFDEVDMFLDGANVEKLSRMVKKQAQGAQFIVVSLRRPMIEASERTIGVTQARGAHTQVLGIKL